MSRSKSNRAAKRPDPFDDRKRNPPANEPVPDSQLPILSRHPLKDLSPHALAYFTDQARIWTEYDRRKNPDDAPVHQWRLSPELTTRQAMDGTRLRVSQAIGVLRTALPDGEPHAPWQHAASAAAELMQEALALHAATMRELHREDDLQREVINNTPAWH